MSFSDVLNIQTHNMVKQLIPENLQNVSEQLAEIVQYNLSKYATKPTAELKIFLETLSDVDKKILWIPRTVTINLTDNITIPSNTIISGGGNLVLDGATPNNLWNPSFIANRWGQSENIEFNDITISYSITTAASIMRYRKCNNLTIKKCTFNLSGDGSVSHNAVIDLFKMNTNVLIEDITINIDNPNAVAGGGVWIRNYVIAGNDEEVGVSSNIKLKNVKITSNSGDELISTFTVDQIIEDVFLDDITLKRPSNSYKNVVLTSMATSSNVLKGITYKNIHVFINSTTPISNLEIIRFGSTSQTGAITDLTLDSVKIIGNLKGSQVVNITNIANQYLLCKDVLINNANVDNTGSVAFVLNNAYAILEGNICSNIATFANGHTKSAIGKNFFNGNLFSYGNTLDIVSGSNADGYIKFSNKVAIGWKSVTIDVNNGATKAVTSPVSWSGGTFLSQNVTNVSNGNNISSSQSGINTINVTNYGSDFCVVRLLVIAITA